ncbi:MAG TPA: CDP-diacylglycerol--glycerol-3-phosphate 3-phosphatidyltransferase [Nitrospirota bacterium]|nr:CDP-diacylglycerol--glycerol-3-phosphate 3-phosphatidyltransferase [Nitrospirota bacterium]
MNIPNAITLLRVVLIPFYIDLMIYGYYGQALVVFLAACVTDALDGLIARLMKTQTELGAFLDPMADKLLIISAFVTLVLIGRLPVWLVIIVVSRDVILVLGSLALYLMGHKLVIKPSIIGKTTTVLQLSVVSLMMILINYGTGWSLLPPLFWVTAVVTIVSGVQYVMRGMKLAG